MSKFAIYRRLATVAVRRLTTYGDWRLGLPSDAEFAQHAIDPALFPREMRPFDAREERATIHSLQAHQFVVIEDWKAKREAQECGRPMPRTSYDRLRTAFREVVVARVLQPQDLNVVAAINEATARVDGRAASGNSDMPVENDVESRLEMIAARRQLFDDLVAFVQPDNCA